MQLGQEFSSMAEAKCGGRFGAWNARWSGLYSQDSLCEYSELYRREMPSIVTRYYLLAQEATAPACRA